MANENEEIVDSTNNEGEGSQEETISISKSEWDKTQQTLGSLKRENKDLKKPKDNDKETPQKTSESKSLDRLDKLLLRQEGIKSEEEIALAEEWVRDTGRDLEKVLESKAFKAELKDLRESIASKEATPSSTKRSGQSPRDEVDYWLSKGELPKDNPELARKVVNARLHKEESKNQFADQAVIK